MTYHLMQISTGPQTKSVGCRRAKWSAQKHIKCNQTQGMTVPRPDWKVNITCYKCVNQKGI